MASRPRHFVLLIGAARAVPYPVPPNPTHDTSERHIRVSAAYDNAAGHVRLLSSTPSSTVDLADLVTPVTPAPSSTFYELTEITPVPAPRSSPQTIFTSTPVPPSPTTEGATPAQPLAASPSITIAATGQHISTITITDWVTVTMTGTDRSDPPTTAILPASGPRPVETQTTIDPVHSNSSASGRPDMPGGIMGGPPQLDVDENGEAQPKE